MHNFEYKENACKLLTPEIVNLLSSIYEHKGRQQLFVEAKNDGAVQKEMGSPNYFKFTREFKSAKI